MMEEAVVVRNTQFTRWLYLNRPAKMNALDEDLAESLIWELELAAQDPSVRTVVLTGSGDVFCTGADLDAFQGFRGKKYHRPDFLDRMEILNKQLRQLSKPTIAMVNGVACAGGLELVLCCDLVVALASAKIGDCHSNYAAFPGGGGASVLTRRLGMARAKYLLYTGDLLPAKTFLEWGIFNKVVEEVELIQDVTQSLADKLNCKSPLVMKELKRVAENVENSFRDSGLQDEMNTLRNLCDSHDMAEGFSAFLEKRSPSYRGE